MGGGGGGGCDPKGVRVCGKQLSPATNHKKRNTNHPPATKQNKKENFC